jgi:serine/threonine-protein kinase
VIVGGRYKIEGFVDKGATARVYMADDLETNTKVAVKMFAPSVAASAEMRARFHHGAEVIRAVDHPNVVRVLDLGTIGGDRPYLVLEALVGESLGDRLRRLGRLSAEEALRVSREAATGLAAAHAAGVVHRDVKPDNLFLARDEQGVEAVKLIDFGMAKVGRARRTTSANGFVMGTVEYMAPEQIVSEWVDGRADVYGLGVVMFRTFTGHLPFEITTMEEREPDQIPGGAPHGTEVLGHQLFTVAPPPTWLEAELAPAIERVILSAMRKRRENRYPTMQALLEDLDRVHAGRESMGHPIETLPDVFEPESDVGREAARFLGKQLGVIPASRR